MNQIEKYFSSLLDFCLQHRATDVHFIPAIHTVQVRVRGQKGYIEQPSITTEEYERVCTYIKFLAHLDVADRRYPQSGAFTTHFSPYQITIRASTLPTVNGESSVLRLFYKTLTIPFGQLSIFPKQTKLLLDVAQSCNGLMIFSGPTGSGKTTTMYSLMKSLLENKKLHIVTLEDPVEIKYDRVTQVQINEDAGFGYDLGLKAVLRHDPDVILVGEIRDIGTAQLAHRAALTGHLVLTTLHAKDTLGALLRLIEYKIPIIELEQSVQCIVSQRLENLYCATCKGICTDPGHPYYDHSRTCLYEVLANQELKEVFHKLKKGEGFLKLRDNLRNQYEKGVAYGYLQSHK